MTKARELSELAKAVTIVDNRIDFDRSTQFTGTFASTGIDDNASSTAITINSSQDVTLTGSLIFADNEKTIFGAGSDLQIYHDGSDSYIKEDGTGNLIVAADDFRVTNVAVTETMIAADTNSNVRLYYDNSQKLATTSTGIDVTGTVTAGDITLSDNNPTIIFDDANGVDQNFTFAVNGGTANIQSRTDAGVNTTRFTVSSNGNIDFKGGDISFYEDTGTTPKLFWDASAERLGIGHSSPNVTLHVQGANVSSGDANHNVVIDDTTSMAQGVGGGIVFRGNYGSGLTNGGFIQTEKSNGTSGNYAFDLVLGSRPNGGTPTERMRIDSSGRVGIGASNNGDYHANNDDLLISTSGSTGITIASGTSDQGRIAFADGTSDSADEIRGLLMYNHNGNSMSFFTNASERMIIKADGKVGIGTSSPRIPLDIYGAGATTGGVTSHVVVSDSASYAINVGGRLTFEGKYNTAGNPASWASVAGLKENATDGNYAGYLSFSTRANGANQAERMRIDSIGRVMIAETSNSGYSNNADDLIVGDNGASTERGISLGSTTGASIRFNDGADAGSIEYNHSSNHMLFVTNGSERMRITSAGQVGIGVSSNLVGKFNTVGSNNSTQAVFSGSTGDIARGLRIATGSTGYAGNDIAILDAQYTPRGTLVFQTQSTERMRIDYNGNVGIGTTSPTAELTIGMADLGSAEIDFRGATYSRLGIIKVSHDSGTAEASMRFHTRTGGDEPERMRIDNSGNFMVSTTNNTLYDDNSGSGLCYRPNLSLDIARESTSASSYMLSLNNTGVDAKFINFAKDGSGVGSIGVASSKLHIASTGNSGLRFRDDLNAIIPCNSDGTNSDGDQNLGVATVRFKTLFLSEGIRLGGTGTANELDDYEEGTWTPVAISGWTSATVATAKYTKIGRTVLINLYMTSLQGKNASLVIIGGLPFTVSANVYCTGPVETASGPLGIIRANGNSTQAACYYANASDAERENLTGNDVGVHLLFSVVYETSA